MFLNYKVYRKTTNILKIILKSKFKIKKKIFLKSYRCKKTQYRKKLFSR